MARLSSLYWIVDNSMQAVEMRESGSNMALLVPMRVSVTLGKTW